MLSTNIGDPVQENNLVLRMLQTVVFPAQDVVVNVGDLLGEACRTTIPFVNPTMIHRSPTVGATHVTPVSFAGVPTVGLVGQFATGMGGGFVKGANFVRPGIRTLRWHGHENLLGGGSIDRRLG